MRILQILPELNVGGVETGAVDLSIALAKLGHHVVVVSHGGSLVERLEKEGVAHIAMPVHRKELFTILCMAWKLRRILKEHRIDIVHARSRVPGWIAYFSTRGARAKFVTTAHGAYRSHPGSTVMGWGQKVIVPSSILWQHMVEEFHVPENRLCLIPRGIDLERFSGLRRPRISEQGPVIVGMVGRITPLKGHETFLKALASARKKEPRLKGLIVGDSPAHRPEIKQKLEALTRQLNLQEFVVFEDSRPDVEDAYARLDILVLASVVPESFGRVLVEAQASGVPVLGSAIGGPLDILEDGRTGQLFEAGNADALADLLVKTAQNPRRARDMASAAWEKAQREYTISQMVRRTLNVYEEVIRPKNILVMKFGSLGDVLLAEASLRSLKSRFPGARLNVVVKSHYLDVLKNCPHLDGIIEYDHEGAYRGPGLFMFAQEIRDRRFDLLVDLQNNWRSHLLGFFAGIPWRLGYERKGGRLFLSDAASEPIEKMDPVSHQFYLLSRLDIQSPPDGLRFYGSEEDEKWAQDFLQNAGVSDADRLAALHVGGSPRWQSKQWGLDSFAALINALAARTGMKPLLVGGPDDENLARALRPLLKRACVDAVGQTTLGRLAALLKRCSVLVSSDSAPLHVAAAVRLPFVALFGPTDPKRHAPQGEGRVLFKNPPCGPCYQPICPQGHHRCMKDISLNDVIESMSAVAQQAPASRAPGWGKTETKIGASA